MRKKHYANPKYRAAGVEELFDRFDWFLATYVEANLNELEGYAWDDEVPPRGTWWEIVNRINKETNQ